MLHAIHPLKLTNRCSKNRPRLPPIKEMSSFTTINFQESKLLVVGKWWFSHLDPSFSPKKNTASFEFCLRYWDDFAKLLENLKVRPMGGEDGLKICECHFSQEA